MSDSGKLLWSGVTHSCVCDRLTEVVVRSMVRVGGKVQSWITTAHMPMMPGVSRLDPW